MREKEEVTETDKKRKKKKGDDEAGGEEKEEDLGGDVQKEEEEVIEKEEVTGNEEEVAGEEEEEGGEQEGEGEEEQGEEEEGTTSAEFEEQGHEEEGGGSQRGKNCFTFSAAVVGGVDYCLSLYSLRPAASLGGCRLLLLPLLLQFLLLSLASVVLLGSCSFPVLVISPHICSGSFRRAESFLFLQRASKSFLLKRLAADEALARERSGVTRNKSRSCSNKQSAQQRCVISGKIWFTSAVAVAMKKKERGIGTPGGTLRDAESCTRHARGPEERRLRLLKLAASTAGVGMSSPCVPLFVAGLPRTTIFVTFPSRVIPATDGGRKECPNLTPVAVVARQHHKMRSSEKTMNVGVVTEEKDKMIFGKSIAEGQPQPGFFWGERKETNISRVATRLTKRGAATLSVQRIGEHAVMPRSVIRVAAAEPKALVEGAAAAATFAAVIACCQYKKALAVDSAEAAAAGAFRTKEKNRSYFADCETDRWCPCYISRQ